MSTPLTDKEEAYCQARAQGKGLSAAYRASRDCTKMSTATVNSNAKKIERRAGIQARIEELKRQESRESRESSSPEQPTSPFGLTPKQEGFCWSYVEKSNASEAYRLAYDMGPNTQSETVHREAKALLDNPKITTRIEAIGAELRERNAIKLDDLVDRLRPIIDADIRKVLTWGDAVPVTDPETGETRIAQGIALKSMAELDDAAAAMISKIVQGKDGSLRVELHDKPAAIEKVARLLGLLKEHHEVQVEDITPRPRDPGREVMRAALKRVREAALQHDIMMEAEAAALPPRSGWRSSPIRRSSRTDSSTRSSRSSRTTRS